MTYDKLPQHRRRRLARWAIASTLGAAGCNPDTKEEGPGLVVVQIKRRWAGADAEGVVVPGPPKLCECYQLRSGAAAELEGFEALFATAERTACEVLHEDPACAVALGKDDHVEAGWDSLHVIVDYRPLDLDYGQDIAAPTVTLRVDGVDRSAAAPLGVPGLTGTGCEGAEDPTEGEAPEVACPRRAWAYAHARVALASELPAGALSLHVKVDNDYFNGAELGAIVPPEPGLYFDLPAAEAADAGDLCDLPPGADKEPVLVADQTRFDAVALVPSNWSGTPAVTLEQRLNDVWLARDVLGGPSPVAGATELRRQLTAPGTVCDRWDLTLSSGMDRKDVGAVLRDLAIELEIAGCKASEVVCSAQPACELLAGIDGVQLTVRVSDEARPSDAFVTASLGDVSTGFAATIPLTTAAKDHKYGIGNVPAAAALGKLKLSARVGESEAEVCAMVVAVDPIELQLVDNKPEPMADVVNPQRVATEPDLACRMLELRVKAPGRRAGDVVTVSAGPGASFGGKPSGLVTLVETGSEIEGTIAVLLANDDPALDELSFSASAGPQTSDVLVVPLTPLRPRGDGESPSASFSGSPGKQTVGVDGSKPVVVSGFVYRPDPQDVVRFAAGTRFSLHVEATKPGPVLCGDPLTSEEIRCNPDHVPYGGCKLAPRLVEVNPEGEFSFVIPGGLCLSGDVTFSLIDDVYDPKDKNKCLGERKVDLARTLATAKLVFQ